MKGALFLLSILLVSGPAVLHAQTYDYLFRFGAACGGGASTSSVATKPTFGCGVGGNPLVIVYTEIGVMAPQANRSYLSGYVSNDVILPLKVARSRVGFVPIVLGGYTRLFETGHAVDYGIGLALDRQRGKRAGEGRSLQLELRDYWTFANPTQHNVVLRLNWLIGVQD